MNINIIQIASEKLGKDFRFRKGQLEAIEDILESFLKGEKDLYLLDAPTGSGKSVIAMLVSEALNRLNKTGYIVASDLMLYDQYLRDINTCFKSFGHIKGVDNYKCHVNNERFSVGECRMRGMDYHAAEKLPCASSCEYMTLRRRAIGSPTVLTTYPYWLIQRNYVEAMSDKDGRTAPFLKRDFTIFDEAHRASEIVQSHFSPRIDDNTIKRIEAMRHFMHKHNILCPSTPEHTISRLLKDMQRLEGKDMFEAMKRFQQIMLKFVNAGKSAKEKAAERFTDGPIPEDWKKFMKLHDWAKDVHCKFDDYNIIIDKTDTSGIIRNPQNDQSNTVVFNCLHDEYLMEKHFHDQAGFKLMMTATIGDPKTFLRTIHQKNARYKKIESSFDFSKSPIHYNNGFRMSAKERDTSLPIISRMVDRILERHKGESGIVHTGSYELSDLITSKISDKNRKRMITYRGSKEKEEALEKFKSQPGSVLFGPSILEGLDLFQDLSRFQIIAKIPYPHLGDRYVNARMKVDQEWYDWKTVMSFLQGIGRSIRSEDDWAVTYVLDGCLSDLMRRSRRMFPKEVLERIKTF